MKSETREVYIADDGKVFDSVAACQAHEKALLEQKQRIANLKVWLVSSGFDSTEGRGYHRTTYIVTDAPFMVVLDYCFGRWGKPLDAWYGDGYYESWRLHESKETAEDAIRRSKQPQHGIGLSKGEGDLVFLSDKTIDHPDLTNRVFPWPRPKTPPSTKPK